MNEQRVVKVDPTNPFDGQETWRNTALGKVMVKKFTGIYGEMAQVTVDGGQTVHLTPAERRLNSESAYNAELDPFRNGTMIAVRLIESESDIAEIEGNAAAVTDDEIRESFTHHRKLEARLKQITNVITLDRFLRIGREADAGVRMMERVRERIAEVDPATAERLAAEEAGASQASQPAMGAGGGAPEPQGASVYDDGAFAGGTTFG